MAPKPKRPRVMFDCPEEIRLAIRLRATRKMTDHSSVIVAILREALPNEIKEAKTILASEAPPPPSRRGRRPKAKEDRL